MVPPQYRGLKKPKREFGPRLTYIFCLATVVLTTVNHEGKAYKSNQARQPNPVRQLIQVIRSPARKNNTTTPTRHGPRPKNGGIRDSSLLSWSNRHSVKDVSRKILREVRCQC